MCESGVVSIIMAGEQIEGLHTGLYIWERVGVDIISCTVGIRSAGLHICITDLSSEYHVLYNWHKESRATHRAMYV